MRKITLVKKILANGALCRKCEDVMRRLDREGLLNAIDRVVIADERVPDSEGLRLADRHRVDRAPFFLVEDGSSQARVYTIYHQFVKEVLQGSTDERRELAEILDRNPDLDFI